MAQITLKQLAELSGLSIRTVNRVLKNEGNVVPEKQELILRLAERHCYVPNMAARNLRLKRKSFVGILCGNMETEVFVQKIKDLEKRLSAAGYYPILGHSGKTVSELEKTLNDWSGIAEYIVVMSNVPDSAENFCVPPGHLPLQFIFVDRQALPGTHSIQIDRSSGVCDAVLHLLKSGRRNILHCGNQESRKNGIVKAFGQLPPDSGAEHLFLNTIGEFENGYNLGAEIMGTGADAVFFDTDRIAAGFLKYASEHQIRIPDRIAVVGFDDDVVARMSSPSLASVAHPVAEINSCIMDIIDRNPGEKVSRIFPTRFILRESADFTRK